MCMLMEINGKRGEPRAFSKARTHAEAVTRRGTKERKNATGFL
jgi:hypothetical protein